MAKVKGGGGLLGAIIYKQPRKRLVKERANIQNMRHHPVTRLVKDTVDRVDRYERLLRGSFLMNRHK